MSIKKIIKEAKEKMRREGKELLKQEFDKLFKANPRLTAVAWTQYAPYFNDGDPCTFSVHEFTFTSAPLEQVDDLFGDFNYADSGDPEEGFYVRPSEYKYVDLPNGKWEKIQLEVDQELGKIADAVLAFQNEVCDEDLFEDVYGSDAKIMVTRDGRTEISDANHE
jgi:hypothetical protein